MDNRGKGMSFSAPVGAAVVSILQNICMTVLQIFLSSCHLFCPIHDSGL